MTRKIKQYKPIKFGDRPDPGTVEGHRKAMTEAAETRAYNRRMKSLLPKMQRNGRVCCQRLRTSSLHGLGDTDRCFTCHLRWLSHEIYNRVFRKVPERIANK
jgi:hypothetical protein